MDSVKQDSIDQGAMSRFMKILMPATSCAAINRNTHGLVVVGFAEVDRHDGHIARVVVVIVPVYLVVPRRLLR